MTDPTRILSASGAPKTRRTGLIVAGIAVPVVLIAGGAYAYQQLNGGGTQPDQVLPSSVVAYARLDADPSAAQKIKLVKLIKKSPELASELGITNDQQDLRRNVVQGILSDCDTVDYDKDIKPWIGERLGIGVTDPDGETGILAIQVTDEKTARKGLGLAAGCLGMSDPGIAFSKGYALVAKTQKDVDAAVKDAATKPLSSDPTFMEDMQSLGDKGIASVWVRIDTIAQAYADKIGDPATQKSLEDQRSAAVTLRAGNDNVELTGIGHKNSDLGKVKTVNLGALPNSSVFAASASGGGNQVDDLWKSFIEGFSGGEVDSTVAAIQKETGFVLPGDLKKLLGDNITLVVGDENLENIGSLEGPNDLNRLNIAIALTSSKTAATDIAAKIAKAVAENLGVELAVVSTNNGAVLATNAEYAKDFKRGKNLKNESSFSNVIGDDNSAYGGFFFDIAKVVSIARGADIPASGKKGLDQVKDLKAFGFSATKDGDRVIRGTLKLSFK